MGNRCNDLLKHMETYMEILYKRQSQSLIPWSLKVNIWYDLLFQNNLNPLKEALE